MWKTALKPRWIAGFIFAIAVSGVFVLLSQWQFGRSTSPEMPVNPDTEKVQPLTDTLQPGEFFHGSDADQMVSATGTYDPAKQVLVPGRLHDGKTGYWVVSAFAVDGAPTLTGSAASPRTWIPVARGWVADADEATAPPSGPVQVTGRLLPSEAPVAGKAANPGEATAVSVAELINDWEISSYPGFVAATAEVAGGADVSAAAVPGNLLPLEIGPQPPAQQINWLNLFYSLEWVVFAGFAFFIWWRLVKDDYHRDLEDALDHAEPHEPEQQPGATRQPEHTEQKVQP
ncbi:membrane protein [Pseudarthrobacter chlorophenolicus A6]|uniref:SURF1-like protein n=1 Tax=Pseudarthrobacter chlorophenolicus (strain ATCC 700700 / DSM 12829 / CIP 107037 / JCM 12360 / KCTC 9906 / NCIMB 13794 / A6) TaxID=452863 RepID=B8HCC7_PSECP|nr:SURF1 family protein [Pseudarthrobacter chlorophenolicus]ACL40543.1 membrane protein [Pseudarthrobacter chlorophenolicus A6]SDQ79615.1 Cytochrome oxidase assembly protein ShyY1 [Pseudarthrobacter chlorophenolicus]